MPQVSTSACFKILLQNKSSEEDTAAFFTGKVLEYVRDKNCVNHQLLPSAEDLRAIYKIDSLIPCADSILLGYQKKIDLLAS